MKISSVYGQIGIFERRKRHELARIDTNFGGKKGCHRGTEAQRCGQANEEGKDAE
jgi:hypothetical protein